MPHEDEPDLGFLDALDEPPKPGEEPIDFPDLTREPSEDGEDNGLLEGIDDPNTENVATKKLKNDIPKPKDQV